MKSRDLIDASLVRATLGPREPADWSKVLAWIRNDRTDGLITLPCALTRRSPADRHQPNASYRGRDEEWVDGSRSIRFSRSGS